jgi:transposase
MAVRATTLLASLMGIKQVVVSEFSEEHGTLVIWVRPSWHSPRCSGCGRKDATVHDVHLGRTWRHLDFGGVQVQLRYNLRRVACRKCGVVVERVPWNDDVVSRFTGDFEEQVAFMAQHSDKTTVVKTFAIAWRTVGTIIDRVVARLRPDDPLAELTAIGVDELSYRKQHHYVTLVTDHDKRRIVWGKEGKDAGTLIAFLDELGEERCKKIKVVTMDMSGAFIKAVRLRLPHAQIVFDRFHVQQLVSAAVDETRRDEWRRLKGTPEAAGIKNLRWVLLKDQSDLTGEQSTTLAGLQNTNARLYRAYLLKESLAEIYERKQIHVAEKELKEWLSWAVRSRLPAVVRVAHTIKGYFDDILAYVRWKLTNGLSEGLNNKARLLTRRAYGFHSAQAVLAMIMLCCTGLDLEPVRKLLTFKSFL